MKAQLVKKKSTESKNNKINGKFSAAKLKQSETTAKAPNANKRKISQISPELNEEIQSDSEAEQEQ